jgi:hypothetical protein
VGARPETLDGGKSGDHGLGHAVAGGIGIEAAIDLGRSLQQPGEPSGLSPGARRGKAEATGTQRRATEATRKLD